MKRIPSTATVVLVQVIILLFESGITASLALGGMALSAGVSQELQITWLSLRGLSILLVVVLWLLGRKQALFKAMFLANGFLTAGLLVSTIGLLYVLAGKATGHAGIVLTDVLLMALANILIFSIWYWLIDPPGIDETQPSSDPWEFLFTQRANPVPQYETWTPHYLDYLHLAFTTSVAFSPTDTLPSPAGQKC